MAIEALKSVGAVYQASSTPEVAKETSQPKTQIIDIQTGAAAMAADETLDMIAKAWELAGILVDEKR